MEAAQTWEYFVMAHDGDDSVAEFGPYVSSEAALVAAASMVGRTVDSITDRGEMFDPDAIVTGCTVERYDGEATDASWRLLVNGKVGGVTA